MGLSRALAPPCGASTGGPSLAVATPAKRSTQSVQYALDAACAVSRVALELSHEGWSSPCSLGYHGIRGLLGGPPERARKLCTCCGCCDLAVRLRPAGNL